MDRLRDRDDGCPWDLEQSLRTLKPYLLEESYEALDAIDALGPAADALPGQSPPTPNDAIADHRDELGDVLLQVVFQARIAAEMGWYDAHDVATAIADKMVRRHPHVFAEDPSQSVQTADDVVQQWQQIKDQERGATKAPKSALDGVPRHMPALQQGRKLGKKAAKTGFDWPDVQGPLAKVDEELAELREAIAAGDIDAIEDELGDVLFALTSVARKTGTDPEQALHRTLKKFKRRFAHVEAQLRAAEQSSAPLPQLERWWQEAKGSS